MKILSLTEDQHDEVVKFTTHIEDELKKLVPDMIFAGPGYPLNKPGETIDQSVQRLMPDADWVLDWNPWFLKGLNPSRSYKVACFLPDIHWNYGLNGGPDKIADLMNRNGYDAAITLIRHLAMAGGYPDLYPIEPDYYEKHLKMPMHHQPACINPALFRDLHLERSLDAAFLGSMGMPFYPLRYSIYFGLNRLAAYNNLKVTLGGSPSHTTPYHKHIPTLYGKGEIVGERYVEVLNKTKCFLFDTSVFRYTVYKFPEAQACGALCMSDPPLDMEAMHLIPEENFIPITIANWQDRLLEVLHDESLRERVAKAGYESTMKYNTAEVRAKSLLAFLADHLKD
jgi:hypothetical protein